ncbi:MAG: glycosyltransferase family 4 protein [Propionibacteriaceae bacterium]|nr:glycosyltransferase family 4 protein [Propionibacteriaceae bacterium]
MDSRPRHVWIVNHYSDLPSKDGGSARHLDLARYLPEHGWTASLIVASTTYPQGKQAMPGWKLRHFTHDFGVPALWVRTIAYGSSSALRLLGMVIFAAMLLLPGMTRGLKRPDVIIGSTVHPFAAWAGMRLARRLKVPFIHEIRDVWPETLHHLGAMSPSHPLSRLFKAMATRMCREASLVLSPLPHVDLYLDENGFSETPFLWVSNGFDGEREEPLPELPERDDFTFLYLGNHSTGDMLEVVIDAFDQANRARPDLGLRLRLVGDGSLKPDLIRQAEATSSADRLQFDDWIAKSEVLQRCREADCLIGILMDSPLYRYGVSLNKLYTYMHAFRPVLFASSAPNNPVAEADSGIVIGEDDAVSLAQAMIRMAETPLAQRRRWAHNGYEHLQDNYRPVILSGRLADGLTAVLDAAQ